MKPLYALARELAEMAIDALPLDDIACEGLRYERAVQDLEDAMRRRIAETFPETEAREAHA